MYARCVFIDTARDNEILLEDTRTKKKSGKRTLTVRWTQSMNYAVTDFFRITVKQKKKTRAVLGSYSLFISTSFFWRRKTVYDQLKLKSMEWVG